MGPWASVVHAALKMLDVRKYCMLFITSPPQVFDSLNRGQNTERMTKKGLEKDALEMRMM